MLRFLFWNLNGKALQDRVAKLVRAHETDVLVLAECSVPENLILDALNVESHSPFHKSTSLLRTLAVFTRRGPLPRAPRNDGQASGRTREPSGSCRGMHVLL